MPRGNTAIGGVGVIPRASMVESIHPAVPSPPHASIRRFGTFLNNSNLGMKDIVSTNDSKCVCVCVCARACVCACVRACVHVCVCM